MTRGPSHQDPSVAALRNAGCVFAEEEAAILRLSAGSDVELDGLLGARIGGEPLEQLVGWVGFGGLRLSVGPGVFVPRQRSQVLAEVAIEALEPAAAPVFVEAFAGVAPLAASVQAALARTVIHVTDLDEAALAHARINLKAPVGLHQGDGLDGLPEELRGEVLVIAAVPPYIPVSAAPLLAREARDFEPATALFAGDDGLGHIYALIDQAPSWLAAGGRVLIEMNHEQVRAASDYGRRHDFTAQRHDAPDGQTAVVDLQIR